MGMDIKYRAIYEAMLTGGNVVGVVFALVLSDRSINPSDIFIRANVIDYEVEQIIRNYGEPTLIVSWYKDWCI
jgi:hypothetical protein